MSSLSEFNKFTGDLKKEAYLMPVLFMGHGSPMNGIEDNEFSIRWAEIAKEIPTPSSVLVVSAHWLSQGTRITAMEFPTTIHDFMGFPKPLYDVQYNAPGSPALARETKSMIHSADVMLDHDWGLDHGAWSVVKHMYPEAIIPVLQLSIDYTKGPQYHFDLAKEIYGLRRKGVLIIGSGNMVHNLKMIDWNKINEREFGYDWALKMDTLLKKLIIRGDPDPLIHYENLGSAAKLAIPTPEHFLPLLYTLGLREANENVSFFNDKAIGGSITMTSVKIG